jgi:hypothetical protein
MTGEFEADEGAERARVMQELVEAQRRSDRYSTRTADGLNQAMLVRSRSGRGVVHCGTQALRLLLGRDRSSPEKHGRLLNAGLPDARKGKSGESFMLSICNSIPLTLRARNALRASLRHTNAFCTKEACYLSAGNAAS